MKQPFNVLTRSATSRDYIRVPTVAWELGDTSDPTFFQVEFALPVQGQQPSTWVTGDWEANHVKKQYWARVLAGPLTSFALPVGRYDIYVRVSTVSEKPQEKVGVLVLI
jgi:hypothetical protein